MNYIEFLAEINNISDEKWEAKVVKDNSHFAIVRNGEVVSLSYDAEDKSFHIYGLDNIELKVFYLVYDFFISNRPFDNINQKLEKDLADCGLVEKYKNKVELGISILMEKMSKAVEEHHAD